MNYSDNFFVRSLTAPAVTRAQHFLWTGWLALLVLCFMQSAMAANVVATVQFAKGNVTATQAGQARPLATDEDVLEGDHIDTADNGRVQMRFTDGGLVSLMPGSSFSVDSYLYGEEDDEENTAVFGMLKGGLRTVTGAIGKVKHEQYELRTPVATLGIRGTEYVAVLRPANTLRVHVGRGKVVITNDHGSLEVPEGRHAVVTLTSAPRFTEKAPQYQATGLTGDRLVAGTAPGDDPVLNEPVALMPPTPAPMSTQPDLITAAVPAGWNDVNLFTSLRDDIATEGWILVNAGSSGALSWGEYTDGEGSVSGDPLELYGDPYEYLPFVTGSGSIGQVPGGMLEFSLDGATVARSIDGDFTGTLNQFDLGIDLDTLDFDLDFDLEMDTLGSFTSQSSGDLGAGSSASGFSFSTTANNNQGYCLSDGCALDVEGFLSGRNGDQAGVSYGVRDLNDQDAISGAAALKR